MWGRVGRRVEASDERAYNTLMDLRTDFPHSPKVPKSFTRSELIRSIYERFQRHGGEEEGPRLGRLAQAESLVLAVLDEIAGALERGMRVELRGVGVLTVKQKGGRQGRNPRTGEAVVIDPHRVVRFRVSELLLARLNRPASRPPEPRKSDPRQLVFPINAQQEEPTDAHTQPALPRLARRRTARRQEMI
jgi:integration host factor subunit beta